jgi:hypothetical protein
MIYKVSDSTSFLCSYDHQESSPSYLARHWRSGQNSMISQALHDKNTELKIHVPLHCKDPHSSIHSLPDRTLTLFSTGSPLIATKNMSHSLCLASYTPNSSLPILLIFCLLHCRPRTPSSSFSVQSLHTRPFSCSSFLYKPVSFQISSPPHSPPLLINATSHSLHQSRRHLPAIPSQTTR